MADDLDHIFKALSDPTRRELLDLLRTGPLTTTQLVEAIPNLSRFAVMKHLDVLRAANLVLTRSEGRSRLNSLNALPIQAIAERWIGKYESFWANTLLQTKKAAEAEEDHDKA